MIPLKTERLTQSKLDALKKKTKELYILSPESFSEISAKLATYLDEVPGSKVLSGIVNLARKNETFTPEDIQLIERLKKGNHGLDSEEKRMLENLQLQIIKNREFRRQTLFSLKNNRLYHLVTMGGRNFFILHSHIPLNRDGSFRKIQVDGAYYSGVAYLDALQSKMDACYQDFVKLDPKNDGSVRMFLKRYGNSTFFDRLAWSIDSPIYGRVMKTFEQVYFPKTSNIRGEPKDKWYELIQGSKADSKMFDLLLQNLVTELKIDPASLVIVNGHTANIDGTIKSYHNGNLLCIDGGFSGEYGDLGVMMIATDQGKVYTLSLSENPGKIQKWTLHRLDGDTLVER